jgi:hypothetical protein
MKELSVTRSPEGDLELRHIPPALAFALRELPKLLSGEFPESTSRIHQDPYSEVGREGEDENSEEWARHGHPELRHLFDSAREIVLRDLAGLGMDGLLPPAWRLRIPGSNVPAWLSALAAARVGLGEAHEVTSADLERVGGSLLPNERDRGILLIQLLGWMQAILIGEPD